MDHPRSIANFTMFDNLSDANATGGANQTMFDDISADVAGGLNVYFTPLLVVFGCIGNLLSIYVFFTSKLQYQSTSQYLSALALSDTIFLLQNILPWMNSVHLTGLYIRNGFCQLFVYLTYVTCCVSAWLVVAFTVERFMAVLYPLRRNIICTVTRARYIILTITVAALLLNIPVFKFTIPRDNDCNIDYNYVVFAARFNLVDTVISLAIPLAAIIVLNICIILGVCRLERTRHHLMKTARPMEETEPPLPQRVLAVSRSQQRITKMLLIVSTVFVILNMPAYTMRLLTYANNLNENEYVGRWAALQQFALMCFRTNFGINFVLYCLSGQNFRMALGQTMPRLVRGGAHRVAGRRRRYSPHPARAYSASISMASYMEPATNCRTVAASVEAVEAEAETLVVEAVVEPSYEAGSPDQSSRDTFIRRWTSELNQPHRMGGRSDSEPLSTELIEMQVYQSNIEPEP